VISWGMSFWQNEQAQDLTEYALLLAFVVMASAGIFLVNGSSLTGIWSATSGVVSQAESTLHGS
jgi:Flp pilus assembly pilin Flp